MSSFQNFLLDFDTPTDRALQGQVGQIDHRLRSRFGMSPQQTAVGLLDLRSLRLAMLRADTEIYAASLAKIGILLAFFELNPNSVQHLDPTIRHQLGLMIKASSNEMATRFSKELGLAKIQSVLRSYDLYDPLRGGGLWMGKHYGDDSERFGDPVGDNSHAATVRQLLRFYLWLEQGRLVSPAASALMRQIFEAPNIPHDNIKFVRALQGRGFTFCRKWGSWENWNHDSAMITGPGRHYILVALTHHPFGDSYLEALAVDIDSLLASQR